MKRRVGPRARRAAVLERDEERTSPLTLWQRNLHMYAFPSRCGQIPRPQRRPRQILPCPSKSSKFRQLHGGTSSSNFRLHGISVGLVWQFVCIAVLLFLAITILPRISTTPCFTIFIDKTRALPIRSVHQELFHTAKNPPCKIRGDAAPSAGIYPVSPNVVDAADA